MAAKAHQREYERTEEQSLAMRADYEAQEEEYIAAYAATLTPETAAAEQKWWDENSVGCACIGGPVCCRIRYEARKRVLG